MFNVEIFIWNKKHIRCLHHIVYVKRYHAVNILDENFQDKNILNLNLYVDFLLSSFKVLQLICFYGQITTYNLDTHAIFIYSWIFSLFTD